MAARSWMSLVQIVEAGIRLVVIDVPAAAKVRADLSEERDALAAYWRWLSSMVVSARFPIIFFYISELARRDGIVCTIHQKVEVWVRLDGKLRPGRSLFADSEYTGGLG